MNLLVSLPLLALWWFHAEHVMLLLGQEPDVVPLAAQLLRTMSPALLVWSVVYPINSYLTAQGQVRSACSGCACGRWPAHRRASHPASLLVWSVLCPMNLWPRSASAGAHAP